MMLDFSDGEPVAMWTTDLVGEERMQLTLGDLHLSVAQPGSSAVGNVGTGALVWQAGPALATALVASGGGCLREQIRACRAIELGCGCSALPGVALALLGVSEVIVSDSAAILEELQPNLAGYYSAEDAVSRRVLRDVIVAAPLDWADAAALAGLARNEGRALLVAADCDYADTLHGALLDAVSAALSPSTSSVALFATAARCERTLRLFLSRLCERHFEVIELSASLEQLHAEGEARRRRAAQDGVRFFAARWRSEDDAKAARARFAQQ